MSVRMLMAVVFLTAFVTGCCSHMSLEDILAQPRGAMQYYWLHRDKMQCPVCGASGWYVDSACSARKFDHITVHRYKCVKSHMWLVIQDAIRKTSVVVIEN